MEQFQKTVVPMQTSLEKQHVQQVYEAIASHFSETRYKVCQQSHLRGEFEGNMPSAIFDQFLTSMRSLGLL